MGILNVTPDSFSDGGRFLKEQDAVCQAMRMIREGADIIDIGGESTRPGSEPVPTDEELKRVLPVIRRLKALTDVPLSIDTVKPAVADEALAAGAVIVNDVAANREDRAMWEVLAKHKAGYVLMHMQGTPRTMQDAPCYDDVVSEVRSFFKERLQSLESNGVLPEQVAIDPGIGFGKTLEHNLKLIAGMPAFIQLQRPQLLGVSRKSFMGKLFNAGPDERLPASLACAAWATGHGADILRVHDVAETVQVVRMVEALQNYST